MQRQNLNEQAAYEKLRKAAMDKGLRLGEVAQRMLDATNLVMVTHDVDEAVLLSDRIVMMNGPSATIGEVLNVDLPRLRDRVALAENTQYLHYCKAVIDFLYTRQAHVEKLNACN